MEVATTDEYSSLSDPPPKKHVSMEKIDAEKFVKHRFENLEQTKQLHAHFYPFHEPNILITSPCQSVELFLFLATSDKYCTIIGFKKPNEFDTVEILNQVAQILRNVGVRYVETIVRADKLKTLDRVLRSKFIPCAYFPAFQLHGDKRYDYVALSRTFEILDFSNLNLEGKNQQFLTEYFKNWEEHHLKSLNRKELFIDK